LVGAITGAEHGKQYWMDCQHYYKCGALIVENLDKAKQKLFTIGKFLSHSNRTSLLVRARAFNDRIADYGRRRSVRI
jgi:hypothetical protein